MYSINPYIVKTKKVYFNVMYIKFTKLSFLFIRYEISKQNNTILRNGNELFNENNISFESKELATHMK